MNAADGSPDAERPLTDKGREQSRAAGAALKAIGVELDACLTSPKVRAAETALYADLVESTPLAERYDVEVYSGVLRAFEQACRPAIDEHEGLKMMVRP